MANRLYRKYVHALMTGGSNIPNLSTANIKAALIDTGAFTPDTTITGHEYLSDVTAGIVNTTGNLASVTVTDGVLDAADTTLPDTGGATGENIIIYADTGTGSTSRLLALIDTATGLPITPDSVNDIIRWHTSGIFAL